MKNIYNFEDFLKKQGEQTPYYNGGFVKKIKRINKKYNNGYSIEGTFFSKKGDLFLSGGLYLLCDIQGSRNHPQKNYYLLLLSEGKMKILQKVLDGGRDWALKFWDTIERNNFFYLNKEDNFKTDMNDLISKYGVNRILEFLKEVEKC